MAELFADQNGLIQRAQTMRVTGRVREVVGLSVLVDGFQVPVGALCSVERTGDTPVMAQVVGTRGDCAILMTLQEPLGIRSGEPVVSRPGLEYVPVGRQMLGRVLDGFGRPVGEGGRFGVEARYPVFADPPAALERQPIVTVLPTGIRSIDALHTLGAGQRLGIFAGTGVGKSVLLGMMARNTDADVIVAALIGERGREVGDFLRKDLGDERLKRCVLVVSTSDQSPVLRVRAAFVATAIAEYFRDLGNNVLLLMDSTTRIAMAQRQIGLSSGEPPTTRGYPPSVFGLFPRLLERCGRTRRGSITGLYAVLVEGDDINEPISDAIRGVLDGHVWLSRDLANRGQYPAVSVLESISRVMCDVVDDEHVRATTAIRSVLSVWNEIQDLVNVGAYAPGSNLDFDVAVRMKPLIDDYLRQAIDERADFAATRRGLLELAERVRSTRTELQQTKQADMRPTNATAPASLAGAPA